MLHKYIDASALKQKSQIENDEDLLTGTTYKDIVAGRLMEANGTI